MDRKKIKRTARSVIKNNYLKCIVAIFITSLVLNNGYNYSSNTYKDSNTNKNGNNVEVVSKKKSNYELLDEFVSNTMNRNENDKEKEKKTRGVLAPVVNTVTKSDSAVLGILNSLNLMLFKNNINGAVISFIAVIIVILFAVFIQDIIVIGRARFFLEQRRYKKTSIYKLIYPYKVKKIPHLAGIIFFKNLWLTLWSLTIIGGIIKNYEYSMIEYILAENPSINRKDAFQLSKELTDGYKMQLFKLDISLIGWYLLGVITFNLSNLLYFDAYKTCINTEVYMNIRKKKWKKVTDKNLRLDNYLDIDEIKDESYPEDKYIIPMIRKEKKKVKYEWEDANYSITSYILFFFTFAFVGWAWEVMLHLVHDGVFVNRGTMFGPWLPIYGFGAVLILILLKPLRKNQLLFFVSTIVLAGVLEYSTSWYLETFKGMKWWDYTGYFLNINGRVCLEGLLVFGMGGYALTYFLAPVLNELYSKIKPKIAITTCTLLVILFGSDMIYSSAHPNTGKGITDYQTE